MKCSNILFVLLVFTAYLFHITESSGTTVSVSKDVLDRRSVNLNGEWDFYYGKFLSQDEMERLPSDEKIILNIPSNWMNASKDEKRLPAWGAGTYYLKLALDPARKRHENDFAIRVGDITSAYNLYVNGELVLSTGVASEDSTLSKPGFFPTAGFFHDESDTLRILIHASNWFYPHFSGISRPISFGTEKIIGHESTMLKLFSILLTSMLFFLFLFELIVFLALPREKSHLMVALLALIFTAKMLLDSEFTIFHLFPDFNYLVGYRIWLASFAAVPVFIHLIKITFPDELHRGVLLTVDVIYGLFLLTLFILPLPVVLKHFIPVVYISMACGIYIMVVMFLAVKHKRKYALAHFISFSIAIFCVLYDLVIIANPGSVQFISQFGITLCILTQTLIILYRFIQSNKLTVQLAEKLEQTNSVLENTVEERTLALQEANKKLEDLNHLKNFMLATSTHDLKNTFNVLGSMTRLLQDDQRLTPDQRELTNLIKDASEGGYQVLENVLNWARVEMTDSEMGVITELSAILEYEREAYAQVIHNKNLDVQLEVDDSLHFRCAEHLLKSICHNLLSNALKFSLPGGVIEIGNRRTDEWVELYFRDHGIGMPPEILNSVFDNTLNKKRRGTAGEYGSGLGLLIVQELIKSCSGTITCTSQPNIGTEFVLRFPAL